MVWPLSMILHWQVPDSLVHSEVEFMGILLARGPVGNFCKPWANKTYICLEGSNRMVFLFVCLASTTIRNSLRFFQFAAGRSGLSSCLTMDGDIFGGRNPAPNGMYKTPWIVGLTTYQLVQDFFHQQYCRENCLKSPPSFHYEWRQIMVMRTAIPKKSL